MKKLSNTEAELQKGFAYKKSLYLYRRCGVIHKFNIKHEGLRKVLGRDTFLETQEMRVVLIKEAHFIKFRAK